MADGTAQVENGGAEEPRMPLRVRLAERIQHSWRPAGTLVAIALAMLTMYHVVYGKHGLSVWQHTRAEDRELQREIGDLRRQNAQMQQQIQDLKSDPDAIEREAREKLHYARPGEVIYTLPDAPPAPGQPGK